ncbi:unnamed protein product [Cuscuta europaea]|uniref:Uncharacterized protein n=1 Tax=Cuscuta europaea TaxID=41803 RepID=A0A9P0YS98_CUSEU|nr:unnamed protein product [Cuscuta europaea]
MMMAPYLGVGGYIKVSALGPISKNQSTVLICEEQGRGRSSSMMMALYLGVGGHIMMSALGADLKELINGPHPQGSGMKSVFKYDDGTVPGGRWPYDDVDTGARSERINQRSSSARSGDEAGLQI